MMTMDFLTVPKHLNFGFGDLVEVSYLEKVFGIHRRTALRFLKVLHISPMYVGKDVYFSMVTFQRILFVLSRPGSPGFLWPGSRAKGNMRLLKDKKYITEVTDEILKQAADPKILAEMAGCSGNNPGILGKFVANPVGRPRKETAKTNAGKKLESLADGK